MWTLESLKEIDGVVDAYIDPFENGAHLVIKCSDAIALDRIRLALGDGTGHHYRVAPNDKPYTCIEGGLVTRVYDLHKQKPDGPILRSTG